MSQYVFTKRRPGRPPMPTSGRRAMGALSPSDVTGNLTGAVSGNSMKGTTAIIAMQQAINLFGKEIATDGVVGAGTLSALQSVLSSLPGPAIFSIAAAFGSAMNPPTMMFVAQHADDYARLLPQYAPKAASGGAWGGLLNAGKNLFGSLTSAPPAQASATLYAPAPPTSNMSTILIAAAVFGGVMLISRKKGR